MPRSKQYIIDEVVDKAMQTFWHNGYENTSVRMLEKDMGINQFSIYSSFGNKHDLFIEVLKKYKQYVKATFLKNLLESEGSLEDIRTFLSDFGHSIRSGKYLNGCLMVNTGMEVGDKDPDVYRELSLYFKFIEETFYQVFEKAKLNNELAADFDSRRYATFFLGSLQGLTLYAKFHSKSEVDEFIKLTMNTIN